MQYAMCYLKKYSLIVEYYLQLTSIFLVLLLVNVNVWGNAGYQNKSYSLLPSMHLSTDSITFINWNINGCYFILLGVEYVILGPPHL